MLLMLPMMMITMMIMVEMKRVLRILVTMMKIRTCLQVVMCFVQFNNIR